MSRVDAPRDDLILWSPTIAQHVRAGGSVRIVGLGTLASLRADGTPRRNVPEAGSDIVYRLTLTAKVVKTEIDPWLCAPLGSLGSIAHFAGDVRHLARALGAPVEIWSPRMTGRPNREPALIATVAP